MLFVLVISKPPFVLWFTILKYKAPIVNFFFVMCWLFFMKSRFKSTISWEFVDYFSWNCDSGQTFHGNSLTIFHEIAIQIKQFMGIRWLFFMKSQFRSTISWEFVDYFSWNRDSGQLFHGNSLTVNCRITNQVKQSARICWLYSMKSQFKSITLKNLRIYSLIWPYPQASLLPSFFFVVFSIILSFMIIPK